MAELKIVVNDVKTGKSYQKAIDRTILIGRKLGEKIKGDDLGLNGYGLQITGGSDSAGFAMRMDLPTGERKRILAVKGVGLRNKVKGKRIRKTVRGGIITDYIAQVNLKVLNYGTKSIHESLGVEEKIKEKKKEETHKKEESKKEIKEVKQGVKKDVKEEKKETATEEKAEEKVQKEELKK